MTNVTRLDISISSGKPPLLHVRGLGDLEAALTWLRDHHAALTAELRHLGCILIRGLPVAASEDFALVRDVLVKRRASYKEKATPRSDYGADVYSSTDLPSAQRIQLHNENSYTLEFPGILIFGCVTAPSEGGATIVGDMRRVLDEIPAPLAARFRAVGWLLKRCYGEFLSTPWPRAFGLSEPDEVARYCDEHLIGYEWRDNDGLRTVQRRSAIIRHPETGEEVWFNHVAFWNRWSLDPEVREVLVDTYGADSLPFDTAYGDGTLISQEDVQSLNEAYARVTMRESWQPGDVMMVDNILTAHGREPFKGTRKILVAMGEPVQLSDCAPTVEPTAQPRSA